MSALLLPPEPDDRPPLTAVPATGTTTDRRRTRSASGPTPSGRSTPSVHRTTPAGRPRPRTALAGPERRGWDPLRFQPALASDAVPEEGPAARRRRGGLSPAVGRGGADAQVTRARTSPGAPRGRVTPASAEALLGLRPAEQLARWTTPELFDALVRRAGLARRILGNGPRAHPVVRSVHLEATASGACEAAVVLHDGERARAAAARLIVRRGRWVLDRLEIA